MKNIKTKLKDFLNEQHKNNDLDNDYIFDKSKLDNFIKNARKYKEKDFVEDYVDLNNIGLYKIYNHINKGDEILMVRRVRDEKNNNVYRNGIQVYAPYKTVIADKDYGSNHWTFILDNTKELQEEAKILYRENKNNKKPQINKKDKTIKGYHASPNKFTQFMYGENKTSGQLGAEFGFFFFKDIKFAKYYASVIKDNKGISYIYECDIKLGNNTTEKGENIGTNWSRIGFLEQSNIEGFDTVIIEDADTGYGITDEIIVFDDDNIKIVNIIQT